MTTKATNGKHSVPTDDRKDAIDKALAPKVEQLKIMPLR